MLPVDELVYIVDLNDIDDDGDTTISTDFTVQYGIGVTPMPGRHKAPRVNTWVRVHNDDDNVLFYAKVRENLGDGNYRVTIKWDSRERVLNDEWSAADQTPRIAASESATQPAVAATGR